MKTMIDELRLNVAKMEKDLEFIKKDFHEFKTESKTNHRDITSSIKEVLSNQRTFERTASENFVSKKKHESDINSLREDMKEAKVESKSSTRYWIDKVLQVIPWAIAALSMYILYVVNGGGLP